MELKGYGRVLQVEVHRQYYLFLNGNIILSSDSRFDMRMTKKHVLDTLAILNISFVVTNGDWENEHGFIHKVTEIDTGITQK